MGKEQDALLKKKIEVFDEQIQKQQREIKNLRKYGLCIGITLAISQAALAYSGHMERQASLALIRSDLRSEQIDLIGAQNDTIQLRFLEKVMEFLSEHPEFQEFLREDPEFLDSIQSDVQEVQGRIEDNE